MRDWLIKKLGGYTRNEYRELSVDQHETYKVAVSRGETIRELQALIPVSAVTPKKRGRPRKAGSTYIAKASSPDYAEPMN